MAINFSSRKNSFEKMLRQAFRETRERLSKRNDIKEDIKRKITPEVERAERIQAEETSAAILEFLDQNLTPELQKLESRINSLQKEVDQINAILKM